ncbi:MAG: OmpA family protein [Ignavibacteriota bacterium]
MIRKHSLTFGFILFFGLPLFAQNQREQIARFGGFTGGGLNCHSANFQTLPGVPSCCPRYENGNGWGVNIGGFYDWLMDSPFSLEFRLGYSTISGTLKADERTTVIVNDLPTTGEFEHTVAASIGMIGFSPLLKYVQLNPLTVLVGPTIGWITSNNFTEKEVLLQPQSAGTFENGQRTRNNFSGTTPGASKYYVGIGIGAQYQLPLNSSGTMCFLPEVFYTYGLTPIVKGLSWHANSMKVGVSLQYVLFKDVPPREPPPPPPPVIVAAPIPPILTATLQAAMLDTDLVEQPLHELLIEDYIRTQYRPLLNYVFFDTGSSEIPLRYHRLSQEETESFSMNKFNDYETLPLYYEVLNIIGKRMNQYKEGKITIVGCNDDLGIEKSNRPLSRSRAENVYAYLKNTWQVPPARMNIAVRNLPEKPSTVSDTDGAQENRRVEIYSNLWKIVEPVLSTDTAHVPKPPVVRFISTGVAQAGVRKWEVAAIESDKKLKEFSGKDSLRSRIDWELEKEHESVLASLDTVSSTLSLGDRIGQEVESKPVNIPVRHYTLQQKHREGSIDTIISRYSLILFDFDRGELSEANRRIADFVKNRISDEARITILGYTDRIGTDEYNRQLSESRARSAQKYIGLDRAEVKGLGRRILLYDNSLPEGRFYSRTVTIIVSTPTRR